MTTGAGSPPASPVEYDPFAGPALLRTFPSTESQREIWTAAQLGRDASLAYNESNSLVLRGPLDVEALRRSLTDLVARHESLRATFSPDGMTVLVAEASAVGLAVSDVSGLSADDCAVALRDLLAQEVERPFDFERGPLFRAQAVRLGPDEHQLVFTGHHIVVDGWSTAVLVSDWARLYSARRAGLDPELPPADAFSAYAREQAEGQELPQHAAHEAYWVKEFAGQIPVLALPTDRPRPAARTFASRRIDFVLESALVQQVKRAGAREGATLFATLLAAFDVLLHRVSGQEDLVVGIPAAGQSASGRPNLVGHCVNTLPLRCRVEPAEAFRDLLRRVRTIVLDAFEHQEVTFGALLKRLPISRDPSRPPLVSVLFNLDRALPGEALRFDGLDAVFRTNPRHFESFEVFVNAVEGPAGLTLECQYNLDLFDAPTIERWMAGYERVLRAVVADAGTAVGALDMLTAAEKERILAWNPAPRHYARERLVHDLVAEQARRRPEAVAVQAHEKRMTYGELDRRANQLAHRLRALGVGRGTRVGLCVERTPAMLVALQGILRAGGAYVPLDPSHPAERLRFIARDSGMAVLVCESTSVDRVPGVETVVRLDAEAESLARESHAALLADELSATPESAAYAIYTSGSTGVPKGVEVPHRALTNFLASMTLEPGMSEADRVVALTTLSFDIAGLEVHLPLTLGASIVLVDHDTAMDATALAELLEREGPTVVQATPATWRLLLGAGWRGDPRLRILCGGEALPLDLAVALLPRCGELWNMYGPTETTIWSTCQRVSAPVSSISIGRPIANTQVYVVDEQRRLSPIGIPGELWIGGDGVAVGYLNRAELNAECFLDDPFRAGGRVYRTGDLARWRADGTLQHLGRLDQQVKVRGFRIEPGEIESALAAYPGVAAAAVEAREIRPGDVRLVAYLVWDGTTPDDESLRAHLRLTLPEYMVPQLFMQLRELPLTPSGKIDRKALPTPEVARAAVTYAPPQTATETLVAGLWQDALGVGRIGRDDSFFHLGGHSLLAAQVLARLNREHAIVMPFRAVFEAPTVLQFAALIDGRAGVGERASAERIPRRSTAGPAPVTIMQERILLLEELDLERRLVHNLPSAFRLEGRLDVAALEASLTAIIARHEALRTTFQRRDQGRVQVVGPPYEVRLPVEDLASLAPDEREATLKSRLREERRHAFDLERGPLFRARLFRVAEDDHVLFSLRHNTVWDGWSFDVFRRDLAALYTGQVQRLPVTLPELSVSYSDFAEWQAGWLGTPECTEQLSYWRTQLAGGLEPLEIPTDRPRRAERSHEAADEWFDLPRAEVDALTELGRASGATLFMTLFGALSVLLHRYTGQQDLLVAVPVRNRARPEVEDLIGLFTNTLAIRVRVDPARGFLALLAEVRSTVLEAFSRQEAPFELVSGDAPPLRIMFSMQEVRHRATSLGDVKLSLPHLVPAGAAFDLNLWLLETHAGLTGALNYNTDLFDRETIVHLLSHFRRLLASIVENPRQELVRLALASREERARLDAMTAGTAGPPPERLERVALASATRDGALAARVRQAQAWLSEQAGAGRVALALENPLERLTAALAVLSAGGVVVLLDTREPRDVLVRQLTASGATLVWAAPGVDLASSLPHVPADFPPVPAAAAGALPPAPREDELASVVFVPNDSGGSAAVEQRHVALSAMLAGARDRLGLGRDAVALLTPDSTLLECLLPLAAGGAIRVADAETCADGRRLADLIDAQQITFLAAAPPTWRRLLSAGWTGRASLTALVTSFPSGDLASQLRSRVAALWTAYGSAEAGDWCALERVGADAGRLIGAPAPGVALRVLDVAEELCPIGVPGEICAGGVQTPSGRLLRTGDRARRRTDGRLEHLGRLDARVLIGGVRVEPDGVAAVLSTHPAVSECVVIGSEDAAGEAYLVAFVVRRATGDAATNFAEFSSRRLRAASVPRRFLEVQALPRQPDGALDRRALTALAQAAELEQGFVRPRTPTEIMIAEMVAAVLGRGRVGVTDDFHALGFRSLQAARLGARIAEAFGTRLSIATILTNPTVARLAEIIASPGAGTASGLVLLRPGSRRSAVFIMPDLAGLFGHARRLAERIASGHAVYSLCLPERDGEPFTFEKLEDLARYCVGRIAAARPEAPCHLVGYSFGGTLAFEVARQLHAAGLAVGMVAIIDAEATFPGPRSLKDAAKGARMLFVEGLQFARRDLRRGWLRTVRGRLRRLIGRIRGEHELKWVDDLVAALPIWDLPPAYREVATTHLRSLHWFEEQPYPGRITLIRSLDAERKQVASSMLRDLGWSRIAAGGVEVRVVSGDHYNILDPPHLDAVGWHLTDSLGSRE